MNDPGSKSETFEASAGAFATTHWSVVLEAGREDSTAARDALETLCRAYWPAIHAYVRRTGQSPENARALTQAFFARLLDRGLIAVADRRRGRFRTFLLTLLQRFLADQHDHATALKRGGGELLVSLDDFNGVSPISLTLCLSGWQRNPSFRDDYPGGLEGVPSLASGWRRPARGLPSSDSNDLHPRGLVATTITPSRPQSPSPFQHLLPRPGSGSL